MFKVFQGLFAPPPSRSITTPGHRVTRIERVIDLLRQTREERTLLQLRLNGHSAEYNTALLGVYPKHGFLVLDELTPKEGHNLFLKEKVARISGKLDGVAMSFLIRLIETRNKAGIAFYKVDFPDLIYFRQRRQHFRVGMITKGTHFRAYRSDYGNQPLEGEVHDISTAGIGVILKKDIALNRGESLSACTVNLPGEGNIAFSLEVAHALYHPERRILRMGGKFIEIDSNAKRKIQKTVCKLEREHVKRRRKAKSK